MLRHSGEWMLQHFSYVRQWHVVSQCDNWCETMAALVCGQVLFDAAQVGNLFQETVHLLIARNEQQSFFIHAVGLSLYLSSICLGMLKSGVLHRLFVFSRGFTIHRLSLPSSEMCSWRRLYPISQWKNVENFDETFRVLR